mmetsp:Transcript_65258/g.173012  ORF Transcript_65258/g.173012 Transcript_65258/m.173012 type:complete len:244 (+) Transcript_65258:359-1090(+)
MIARPCVPTARSTAGCCHCHRLHHHHYFGSSCLGVQTCCMTRVNRIPWIGNCPARSSVEHFSNPAANAAAELEVVKNGGPHSRHPCPDVAGALSAPPPRVSRKGRVVCPPRVVAPKLSSRRARSCPSLMRAVQPRPCSRTLLCCTAACSICCNKKANGLHGKRASPGRRYHAERREPKGAIQNEVTREPNLQKRKTRTEALLQCHRCFLSRKRRCLQGIECPPPPSPLRQPPCPPCVPFLSLP